MKDTLCALPFIHLNVMPNGTIHPCCSSPHPVRDESGADLNIRTQSLSAIWNSPGVREIRGAMLRGEEPRQCDGCYRTERAGFDSVRTNYNRMILQAPGASDAFTGYTRIDRSTLKEEMPPATYFDLRFDNVCNLKCVICYASESSKIEDDPVHTAWTGEADKIIRVPNRFGNSKKWVMADELFEELRDFGANTQYIRLAGGEPFRSALALRWLQYLGESGKAANITLQVYTNLQLFNERIIRLIEPFKFISMILSIDGVGETYEYVRYPGKWQHLEENANRLAGELQGRLKRMGVSVNATMSIPGAMRILDLYDWAGKMRFGVTLSNAVDPPHVSTRYLPQAAKERLERQLREYAAKQPTFANMPAQIDQWMADMYSVDTRDPKHYAAVQNAMQFLNDMDASRGLDFKRLQPDLVADYVSECGTWNDQRRFATIPLRAVT